EVPRLVDLVQPLRIASEEVEEIMRRTAEPQSETHAGDADERLQWSVMVAEIAGAIRRRALPRHGLRKRKAATTEVRDLDIAGHRHAPAALTNLQAVIEIVTGSELAPGKYVGNLSADQQAGPAGPVAVLQCCLDVPRAQDPRKEPLREPIE